MGHGAIFDSEVYAVIPNSNEHILQSFDPSNSIQPMDVCMFMCASMNRLLQHSADSTPLPPLNHAIYYAKKKRRKEINEEVEKLKKSRSSNDASSDKAKEDKASSKDDKAKKKQAKEWSDKFFKIFDVAHNGDLDFNEFKKGCQAINIQWKTLFAEVVKKRDLAAKKKKSKALKAEIVAKKEKLTKIDDKLVEENASSIDIVKMVLDDVKNKAMLQIDNGLVLLQQPEESDANDSDFKEFEDSAIESVDDANIGKSEQAQQIIASQPIKDDKEPLPSLKLIEYPTK